MRCIVLSGWNTQSTLFEESIHKIAKPFGYSVSVLDYQQFAHLTYEDAVIEMEKLLPNEPVILFGWSLGGMLAIKLAQKVNPIATITFCANQSFVQTESFACAMAKETFDQFYQGFKRNPSITSKRFLKMINTGCDVSHNKDDLISNNNPDDLLKTLFWLGQIDNLSIDLKNSHHWLAKHDALVPVDAAKCFSHVTVVNSGHGFVLSAGEWQNQVAKWIKTNVDE